MKDKKFIIWAQLSKDYKLVETIRESTDREETAEIIWDRFKRLLETYIE